MKFQLFLAAGYCAVLAGAFIAVIVMVCMNSSRPKSSFFTRYAITREK